MIIQACNKEQIECFTPPEIVVFDLVNSQNKNVIENGMLKVSAISIKDISDKSAPKEIKFDTVNEAKIRLTSDDIGWFDGIKYYEFTSRIKNFNFSIHSSVNKKCGGYFINQIQFTGVNGTPESGFYRIILE